MIKKAFTLIELIVGISIISLFIWVWSLSYSKIHKDAINTKRKINIENNYNEILLLKNRWIVVSSIIEEDLFYKVWWWNLWWLDITTLNKTQYNTWKIDINRAKWLWFLLDEKSWKENIIWATSIWNRFQIATNLKTSRWDIVYMKWNYYSRKSNDIFDWEIKVNALKIFKLKNWQWNFFSWDRVVVSDIWWANSNTLDVQTIVWWNNLYLSWDTVISNTQIRLNLNELEWLIYSTYDAKIAENWDIVKLY